MFKGFPRRARSVPVPAPVFGPLLEQIDDLGELKCLLRVIWLLHQKKGYPRFVTLRELLADRTLVTVLGDGGSPDHRSVERAVNRAVERGALATVTLDRNGVMDRLYALNTEPDRDALAKMAGSTVSAGPMGGPEPWEGATQRPNVFAIYEDNIGMLSPMIAEELQEAEQLYPATWIEEAVREAVSQNKRSWRYIVRILERWEREGRSDGEPRRYPKKAGRY